MGIGIRIGIGIIVVVLSSLSSIMSSGGFNGIDVAGGVNGKDVVVIVGGVSGGLGVPASPAIACRGAMAMETASKACAQWGGVRAVQCPSRQGRGVPLLPPAAAVREGEGAGKESSGPIRQQQ